MTATFSLAPAFLKFEGHNRFVIRTTICGAASMAILSGILGLQYGANGAGFAVCFVLTSVAVIFFRQANKQLSGIRANSIGKFE